jgi:hypothetical protein
MNSFLQLILIVLPFAISLSSCGGGAEGGSEFGNPTRAVIGTLVSDGTLASNNALSKIAGLFIHSAYAAQGCPADQVIATDSRAQTTAVEIADDCSFDLELSTDKAYSVSFTSGDTFVATLIVNNSPNTLRSTVFFVSEDAADLDLGVVTISDNEAIPENEPAEQNDQDEDDVDDYDDEDDDGDGVEDEGEEDCDLDDYEDDYDEDDPCEEEDEDDSIAEILEVIPNHEEEYVALDEIVVVRFDCAVDESSVTDETFRVESDEDVIDCEFAFSDEDSVVECRYWSSR